MFRFLLRAVSAGLGRFGKSPGQQRDLLADLALVAVDEQIAGGSCSDGEVRAAHAHDRGLRRGERAATVWAEVCATLARAGLPRELHEGPVAFTQRAARRWPEFAIAFHAIGESYAMLRYGRTGPHQRAALVATLERAVEVLPPPAALRAGPRISSPEAGT
mgnify:CR=1 FL=1